MRTRFRPGGRVQASGGCHECHHVHSSGFRLFGVVQHLVSRETKTTPPDLIDCTTEIRRVTDIIITQGRPLCDTLNSIQSVCELAVWELLLILVRDSLYAARSLQAD